MDTIEGLKKSVMDSLIKIADFFKQNPDYTGKIEINVKNGGIISVNVKITKRI